LFSIAPAFRPGNMAKLEISMGLKPHRQGGPVCYPGLKAGAIETNPY